MVVVVVSDDNNRRDDADSLTNWSKEGGAGSPDTGDFVYQGTTSIVTKVGTTLGGHRMDDPTTTSLTGTTDRVVMCKGIWTNKDILVAPPSATFRIGSSISDYHEYYIADDGSYGDRDYPVKGGWLVAPIDPNITAWRDTTVGSPDLNVVDYYAISADFSDTSKAPNVGMDAIDISDGLYLIGGTAADPDGSWQDFVDYDETSVTARFGHVSTLEGVLYCLGNFVIGASSTAASATVFGDVGTTIVFPPARVAAGWSGVTFDLSASSNLSLTDTVLVGRGQTDKKNFFHTINNVDDANEEFDIPSHGFLDGNEVIYSREGGTAGGTVSPLVTGTPYYAIYVDDDTFSVATTRANAYAGTAIGLTDASAGETHSLTRQPDIRPDLTIISGLGVFNSVGSTFDSFRNLNLVTGSQFTNTKFLNSGSMDLGNGGVLLNCTIQGATTNDGEAFVHTPNLNNIENCDFKISDGHAIELTAAGTFTFIGNDFTGYGAGGSNDAAIFNNSSGAVTINVTDADSPTIRNGLQASTTVNNNVLITLTNLVNPTEVRVYADGTTTELHGQENVSNGSFAFSQEASDVVDIRIYAVSYLPADIIGYTIPGTATSLPIQQIFDRNYENP